MTGKRLTQRRRIRPRVDKNGVLAVTNQDAVALADVEDREGHPGGWRWARDYHHARNHSERSYDACCALSRCGPPHPKRREGGEACAADGRATGCDGYRGVRETGEHAGDSRGRRADGARELQHETGHRRRQVSDPDARKAKHEQHRDEWTDKQVREWRDNGQHAESGDDQRRGRSLGREGERQRTCDSPGTDRGARPWSMRPPNA